MLDVKSVIHGKRIGFWRIKGRKTGKIFKTSFVIRLYEEVSETLGKGLPENLHNNISYPMFEAEADNGTYMG